MGRRRPKEDTGIIERRERVAALRLKGWAYRRIASEVGVSYETVRTDLAAMHEQWKAEALADIDEYKRQELETIALMQEKLWGDWELSRYDEDGAPCPGNPAIAAQLQKCTEQKRKILGLDAPVRSETKTEIVGPAPGEADIFAVLSERLHGSDN